MTDRIFDLLLKGGQVIDPAQDICGICDVAVSDGCIAAVAADIDIAAARRVVPVPGRLVTPGLIDMHCHPSAIDLGTVEPDDIGIVTGVTTVCEGGEAGAYNFYPLLRHEIEMAGTDMFCFINLAVTGLAGYPRPEIRDEHDIDVKATRRVIEANREVIKGIKIRAMQFLADTLGIGAVATAKELAVEMGLPLVVHIGEGRRRGESEAVDDFTRSVVAMLEKGDVLAHFLTASPGGMILPDGTVYPELLAAQQRGVILDACTGRNHLSFTVARRAIEQGIIPSVITTDTNASNIAVAQSLPVTMSKFLNMGLDVEQVIAMTTATPAGVLGEGGTRGSLKPGLPADITVMELVEGDFLFSDGRNGNRLNGDRLLEPRLVLKDGQEYPCYSRYHIPEIFNAA